MGIDLCGLKMLTHVQSKHGSLGATMQLGRQSVNIGPDDYPSANKILLDAGLSSSFEDMRRGANWADQGLFPSFGASRVTSADASPFEGAELVHDFNTPIGTEWYNCFDTAIDAGTLEHIFNLPVALANMMSIVRVGGRLIIITIANNFLGHGFYQFCPELFYRALSAENGYRVDDLFLMDAHAPHNMIPVEDSVTVGHRVEFGQTGAPFYMMICATKIAPKKPFERSPQQSDYSEAWKRHQGT